MKICHSSLILKSRARSRADEACKMSAKRSGELKTFPCFCSPATVHLLSPWLQVSTFPKDKIHQKLRKTEVTIWIFQIISFHLNSSGRKCMSATWMRTNIHKNWKTGFLHSLCTADAIKATACQSFLENSVTPKLWQLYSDYSNNCFLRKVSIATVSEPVH